MDVKLKQRLIGAIVLVSIAIIVLPLILDGSEEERLRIQSKIPEPPEIDLEELTVNDVARKIKQMEKASEARLPQEVVDETDYIDHPDFVLDKNNLPVSWSLQIGSFESQENAKRLLEKLRGNNYRAYILYARTNEGKRYRVFVGPSSSKVTLIDTMALIESDFGLTGRIVRYKIEEDKELLGG